MLEFVRIAVGTGEPLACARCSPPTEHTYLPSEQITAAIRAAVAEDAEPTGPNLCLSGPEPFGHPELPALVAACRQAGARRIALETDAAALSVPANSAGVVAAGVHHLHVRLLAADPSSGESVAGKTGRTADSLTGIAAYLQAARTSGSDVVVTLRVPVCTHNLEALPAIVLRAASLGAHAVRLLHGGDLPPTAPSVLAAACDTGMVNGVWVEADEALSLPPSHGLHVVAEAIR